MIGPSLAFFSQRLLITSSKATVKATTTYEHYEHLRTQTTCNIHVGIIIKLFFEKSIFEESIMAGESYPMYMANVLDFGDRGERGWLLSHTP